MNDPKKPVRDFRCSGCGVTIKGYKNERGEIVATDRPYTDGYGTKACRCFTCIEKENTA